MTYKINYNGRKYEVKYNKEILTDGKNVIITHYICHDEIHVHGITLEESVKKFCNEMDIYEKGRNE